MKMKIAVLDAATLGADVDLSPLYELGEVTVYAGTPDALIPERVAGADVIVSNKLKLNRGNLSGAGNLKLICLTATGYDSVDTGFCIERGIALCNIPGYSTHSVAQLTVAMALSLTTHLMQYREYVHSGAYSQSGIANRLSPAWHELYGKTWGIVGGGNIGRQVARIADAFGCRVLVCRRKADPEFETVDLDTLCEKADILSIHVPLTEQTRGMIGREQIARMKPETVLINVARGAVCDEEALTQAIETRKIGALGVDVYSTEPFGADHPFSRILDRENVCLTPHTAWGAVETRNRCIAMTAENIRMFTAGVRSNRVV